MNRDREAIEVAGKALAQEVQNILGELPTVGFGSSYEDVEFIQERFVPRSMKHLVPRFNAFVEAIQLAGCMSDRKSLSEFDLREVVDEMVGEVFAEEQERVRKIADELRNPWDRAESAADEVYDDQRAA